MTVDSNARRQAILYEVAAVATRYEQDTACETPGERLAGVLGAADSVAVWGEHAADTAWLVELAGRCVAWLEHLAEIEAKA